VVGHTPETAAAAAAAAAAAVAAAAAAKEAKIPVEKFAARGRRRRVNSTPAFRLRRPFVKSTDAEDVSNVENRSRRPSCAENARGKVNWQGPMPSDGASSARPAEERGGVLVALRPVESAVGAVKPELPSCFWRKLASFVREAEVLFRRPRMTKKRKKSEEEEEEEEKEDEEER